MCVQVCACAQWVRRKGPRRQSWSTRDCKHGVKKKRKTRGQKDFSVWHSRVPGLSVENLPAVHELELRTSCGHLCVPVTSPAPRLQWLLLSCSRLQCSTSDRSFLWHSLSCLSPGNGTSAPSSRPSCQWVSLHRPRLFDCLGAQWRGR